jgi:hypothetical protein
MANGGGVIPVDGAKGPKEIEDPRSWYKNSGGISATRCGPVGQDLPGKVPGGMRHFGDENGSLVESQVRGQCRRHCKYQRSSSIGGKSDNS